MGYRAHASKGSKSKTGKGLSAAAKHAYHLRADGYAAGRDGPREDLAASGHGNLPAFAADDPAAFWLASDSFERANGTLFRELQLNLPGELSLAQQQEVLKSYCARLFDGERLPHSWAIHRHTKDGAPAPGENDHAHLMVSETMTDDFPRPAEQHFKRYNSAKPEAGGAKKTRSLKPKAWLMEARAAWAEEVNRGLVAAGHKPRFDHRSKEVQRDDALRLGDLRRAARQDTPTQAHEGPRIAGMRRRVEAGKVALGDLPDYAQEVIKSNDQAREYTRAWLDQVEQMTDAELAEHFADELNHGAHVEAWLLHEHAQALEEDRARSVAIAQQAGELELLTAAQIEAAERAAIAGELADLIDLEQAHSAALIDDQQREAAPMQAVEQARARIEQQTAELREQLPEARQALAEAADRAAELRSMAEPPACQQAIAQRQQVAQLAAEAQRQTAAAAQWRQAHPARAWIADRLGIEPAADRAAREARDAARTAHRAYDAGDTKARAVAWQQTRTELAGIEQRLPELREQQRQIEEELLQHAGPEALRKATEQQLARAQRAEQHMQPHDLEHAQERRQELADRLHQGGTPADQVQLYRDAEQHGKEAERLGQDGAQVRSITCLRIAREQLAEARQALKDAPEPELAGQLAEADAQAREWQMDPRQRGSVDDCERLLEQSGELRDRAQEAAQQELEQRAGQHLGRMEGWEQIEQQRQAEARQELERLRDRPAPGEDGPRRSGPRFSGPR